MISLRWIKKVLAMKSKLFAYILLFPLVSMVCLKSLAQENASPLQVKIQELYVGILGRAADWPGMEYWENQINAGVFTLENTRAAFTDPVQTEYTEIYGGLSNTQLVTATYENFLERAPEQAGLLYWVGELDAGRVNPDQMINAVINAVQDPNATGEAAARDLATLENKIAAAVFFTERTRDYTFDAAYRGMARAVVASVSDDEATLSQSKAMTDGYVGNDFRVNTTNAGNNSAGSSAQAPGGGVILIVWVTYDENYKKGDIFAQRYDSSGIALGGEFQVSSVAGADRPVVTALGDDRFMVVWASYDQNYNGDIFAQILDLNGAAIGEEFQVNSGSAGNQWQNVIASLEDGGVVVAWKSSNYEGASPDGDGSGVFAQRFDFSGVTVGTEFQVNTTTTLDQTSPAVAGLVDGGFVIAWTDGDCCGGGDGRDGSLQGVVFQRYGASGAKLGGEVQANSTTLGGQFFPSVSTFDSGGFVVTWDADGSDQDDFGYYWADAYGQIFDAGGAKVGTEFQVNVVTEGEQSQGGTAVLKAGSFVTVWDSDGDGPNNTFARLFDELGGPLGGGVQVNSTLGITYFSRPTALQSGGFIVTWVRDGNILARLFDASGGSGP